MNTIQTLQHHFLIAMPGLHGDTFAGSLIYLCEHSPQGAMGLVVNKTLELGLDTVFEHLDLETARGRGQPVLAGGPVQTERGFVLHRRNDQSWESTMAITEEISLTTSRDVLAAMALGNGPSDALVALGYSGWGPNQLEQELAANAWLTLPADDLILFDTPFEQRLHAAGQKLGVDLRLMTAQYGRA